MNQIKPLEVSEDLSKGEIAASIEKQIREAEIEHAGRNHVKPAESALKS